MDREASPENLLLNLLLILCVDVMQGKWVSKRGGDGDMRMVFVACEDGQLISNNNGEKRPSRVF